MKKILFIKKGKFSQINAKVVQQLQNHFPAYPVEVLDITQFLIRARPYLLILNVFFVIYEYSLDFLRGYKQVDDIKKIMLCTPFLFKSIKKYINRRVRKGDYLFTFQTQSLHDCSTAGIPHFVYTDHTALVNLYYPDVCLEKYKKSENYLKLEKLIYQNADITFVLGSHVANSLIKQYGLSPGKIKCIGAGNNVIAVDEVNIEKYYQKNILFVGIEWFRKGGPLLVEAFQIVLQTHPDAQLTIVGCEPKVNVPNCHVIGKVPVDKVASYFNQATVFCMPSNREPFGIVYIEAMLFKLPVIARNTGAASDFIQPDYNGYLLSNNANEIANALNDLLSDPEKCRQFGERGYQIAKRFAWDKVGLKLKESILPHIEHSTDATVLN